MERVKKFRSLLSILAVCFLATGCTTTNIGKLTGKPAPETRLYMLDGPQLMISELRGKQVVLVFWASYCPHSRKALRRLGDLARELEGRDDLTFVTVSIDRNEELEKVQEIIRSHKLESMRHAFSGTDFYDEAYLAYDVDVFPAIFVIGKDGVIQATGTSASFVDDLLE